MLVMLGVTAQAQKPKYVYVNTYCKGKRLKTLRVIKLVPKVTLPSQVKVVKVTKHIEVPVDRVIYKEVIKYDTVKVPIVVEKVVERQVPQFIPVETITEKIVDRVIQAPITRDIYLGPNVIVTDRNTVHGLGLSALIKNKHSEIFQISGGMMMRDGLAAPTPYVSFGAFIKLK